MLYTLKAWLQALILPRFSERVERQIAHGIITRWEALRANLN